MRDGIKLFTTAYLPSGCKSFPVVLARTPYRGRGTMAKTSEWAEKGFAYVEQDVRGTGSSEGVFYPWFNEFNDGADCLDWLRSMDWCNGRITMTGPSYLGWAQWAAAAAGRAELVGISPLVASSNYENSSPRYLGGAFVLKQNIAWSFLVWKANSIHNTAPALDFDALARHLPLTEIDQAAGLGKLDFWQDWLAHPAKNEYWGKLDIAGIIENIRCPALIGSGWYDIHCQGALVNFTLMQNHSGSDQARRYSRCIIGPWTHGTDTGDMDCGADCDREKHWTRTMQTFLANILAQPDADPLPGEPRIKYFMLGKNEWCFSDQWPVAGSMPVNYYLHSTGAANTLDGDGFLNLKAPGEEPADIFIYNPANPAPTAGGNNIHIVNGPRDQRAVEKREDVLVFTGDILENEITIAGPVKVVLFAATTARDTDFTAKLIDVYPDGRGFNLCDGIIRARYRTSMRRAEIITPHAVNAYHIDCWSTANCFLKGHRIRVEISSSNFPRFDRNPNTGNTFAADATFKIARQTIWHNKEYPSRLILPVIL